MAGLLQPLAGWRDYAAAVRAGGLVPGGAAWAVQRRRLGQALDAAGQLAAYADRARIAGLTCERAYGGLNAP